MSRPDLSLCMIFRDEETMLPDFIASVEGLWDELIAIDTGSTDRSAELLRTAGAQVRKFTWRDDFAAARNASLEPATGRWILFLDADERPTPELRNQIRALLRDPAAGAATLVMRNEWPDGTVRRSHLLRLFRNDPAIRFRHRIHEDVHDAIHDYLPRHGLTLRHLPGTVHHLGYTREVARNRDKKERDLALLRLSLQEDPRDFYCWFKVMEIARFWGDEPLWEETATQVVELLAGLTAQESTRLRAHRFSGELVALAAARLPGDDTARLAWLEQASTHAGGRTDAHPALEMRRGLLLENLGRLEEAAEAFTRALDQSRARGDQELRPRLALCRLALARGDLPQAVDQIAAAVALNPHDPEARLAALSLGRNLVGNGVVDAAAHILEPLATADPEAAIGYLVCCLCLDKPVDLQVDVTAQQAEILLKTWVRRLWESRQVPRLEAFATASGSIAGLFPWLPSFLAAETARLQTPA